LKNKKHTTHSLAAFIGLLVCCFSLHAQPYFFRNYTVESGLSNNTVYCSAQDSSGFMWFGTKDGVNRFDGYHFKVFKMTEDDRTLETNLIGCLVVDKKNTLWVGCQKGLYTFDRQKERMVRVIDSLTDVNALQYDKHGQLWFISRQNIGFYNFSTKKLRLFPSSRYFAASSLCLSNEGDIWACTPNGYLHRFDEATETFKSYSLFSHSAQASSYAVLKIYPGESGTLLAGTTNQGLKLFNIASSSYTDLLTLNPDKTTVYVHDIKKYTDNEYWLATESGIFIYNTINQKFINLKKKLLDPYSLSDNAVYTLCVDKEGGMWAGTYFGGISYYSKQFAAFQKYFPDNSYNSISGSVVREICKDSLQNLWIGTEDAGLNKMNLLTGAITQYKPTGESSSIAYTNIHGLVVSGNDLWIGTFEHGLDIMDIASGKIKKHYAAGPGNKDLKSNFIVSLLRTHSGDIYVGTSNGLFKFDKPTQGFDKAANLPPFTFVSCLMEDNNNTIWIGTHDRGLYFFNPYTKQQGQFTNELNNKNSLPNNTINAIFEDSKANLWFATEGGGLCKLSSNKKGFTIYTDKKGLPSNFVFKVLEDNNHQLWVTTSKGLVSFNPATEKIKVYTKANGLLNDQFNYNAGFKDINGIMYFGSVKGMISFTPNNFLNPRVVPPIFITGFQVQNKELDIAIDSHILHQSILYIDEIVLPYNRSSVSIDFAALSFISPEMTSYSYTMKGADNDWTEIKPNRKIYFTNLSPGKYIFRVKAGINGNWGKEEKQLIIKILSPWWSTTWSYLLYTAIAFAIGYYLLRTYHIISEDKKEKEIYEAKIDFFTNLAHEIRTPLTLIKGPVDNLLEKIEDVPEIKEDVLMMDKNTNRLIALITQILDFRQTETKGFSINFNSVNITEILKENYSIFLPLATKKKLAYTLEVPSNDMIAFADEEALNKIFSNLLNNAVKYAKEKVSIRLLPIITGADYFTIEIENDGLIIPPEMREKIFEPFYRLKETIKKQGTGLGLALARSLAELHNGKLYLKDTQTGINTFVICLPIKPHHMTNGKFKK
jgi:signal transduction histidine kinase/ligand-binding sensor domain-containing protein